MATKRGFSPNRKKKKILMIRKISKLITHTHTREWLTWCPIRSHSATITPRTADTCQQSISSPLSPHTCSHMSPCTLEEAWCQWWVWALSWQSKILSYIAHSLRVRATANYKKSNITARHALFTYAINNTKNGNNNLPLRACASFARLTADQNEMRCHAPHVLALSVLTLTLAPCGSHTHTLSISFFFV